MTQLNDPHDNGAATAAPDDAPDTTASETPATDNGSGGAEAATADADPVAPERPRWQPTAQQLAFRRHATHAAVALELLARALHGLRRVWREHRPTCPRRGKKVHRCWRCGTDANYLCSVCDAREAMEDLTWDGWGDSLRLTDIALNVFSEVPAPCNRGTLVREVRTILDKAIALHS